MPDALDFTPEILALKKAIASGATHVSYGDKSVQYDDLTQMLSRLRWIEGQQSGGATARPISSTISFDRGDC